MRNKKSEDERLVEGIGDKLGWEQTDLKEPLILDTNKGYFMVVKEGLYTVNVYEAERVGSTLKEGEDNLSYVFFKRGRKLDFRLYEEKKYKTVKVKKEADINE